LNGNSIENLSFKAISPERCANRYWDKMNIQLPALPPPSEHFVLIRQDGDKWKASIKTGSRLAG
jgi:hypothetical protein